ncbi:MAG: phosphoglucosamine mutase [Acidimicrobiales bacterium]|jgi:phosphoglucosamine mutase
MAPRFGTDGIRGVAGVDLTPELALALGRAAARIVRGSPFLLGRDTRRSGTMIQAALAAGLTAEGVDVVDAGVIPTPGLAWLAADRGVPAAMVSASHNRFEDNGIKLLGAGGTKLATELEVSIQTELDRLSGLDATGGVTGPGSDGRAGGASGPALTGSELGSVRVDPDAIEAYAEHLASVVEDGSHFGFEVVIDCANGAASIVAPAVLERLGIRHRVLFAEPNGVNINAGCGSTHLQPLQEAVVASGAALGVALDGDADRVLAVDHAGELVDGDQLMAMFACDLLERGLLTGGSIVVTVMSNLGLRQALAARRIEVVETPVGDRYVSDAIEANGLQLGGEQSGHLVFRRHGLTGDGILTALLLLELVARKGRPLAELAAGAMTRLPQVLRNVRVADPAHLAGAGAIWDEVALVSSELGDNGRVLLRASGTEALVRVMAEAPTHELALEVVDRLVAVVQRELGTTTGADRS